MPKPIPNNCLSVASAAEYLGVHEATIARLIARKQLKASRIGRRVIITSAAVARYLEENPAVH
jgi:excisionase family DNA binding protein